MTWWSFVDLISFDWMMTGSLAQSETEDDGVVPQPAPRSRPRSRISLTPSPSSSALVWDHEVLVGKEVHTHTHTHTLSLSFFVSLFNDNYMMMMAVVVKLDRWRHRDSCGGDWRVGGGEGGSPGFFEIVAGFPSFRVVYWLQSNEIRLY